jgi:ribose 5-phosphate isomerase B
MKKLIRESDIIALLKSGSKSLPVAKDDIITPLAWDRIKVSGIKIIKKEDAVKLDSSQHGAEALSLFKRAAIGSDHTGFKVKNEIITFLGEKSIEIADVGTFDENPCDYPDIAYSVASKVKAKEADFGIVIDATGIPSSIAANKVPGIRAAVCYNEFSARSAREHNNANIITLGARSLGIETIKSILNVWLETNFGGGRHQNRLNKIAAIEEEFLKK